MFVFISFFCVCVYVCVCVCVCGEGWGGGGGISQLAGIFGVTFKTDFFCFWGLSKFSVFLWVL